MGQAQLIFFFASPKQIPRLRSGEAKKATPIGRLRQIGGPTRGGVDGCMKSCFA